MVLKRNIFTALGALGLGVFAMGALAQMPDPQRPGDGNIPAPNLFDSVIACTGNVPLLKDTGRPTAGPNPLGMAISMGVAIDADLREDLLYVLPSTNCGGDTTIAMKDDFAYDVAAGYQEVRSKYVALTAAEGALKSAQQAATSSFPNTEAIGAASEQVGIAQAALDLIASGPVYQAAIAEWRAKDSVESAITDWNDAVAKEVTAKAAVDLATYRNSIHLADATSSQLRGLITRTGAGTAADPYVYTLVSTSALNDYVGLTDDGSGPDPTSNTNYQGGKLQFDTYDHDTNTDTPEINEPMTETVAVMRTRLSDAKTALSNLEAFIEANPTTIASLTSKYEEALKRARAEVGHHETQLNNSLASGADARSDSEIALTGDDAVAPYSIASRNAAHQSALATRDAAGTTLTTHAKAREGATKAVIDEFTNPASFYDQLVARRTALKAQKDKVVMDAGAGATETQTTAAKDAQTALENAQTAQTDYNNLVGEEGDPAGALIAELLKTDGDDGKALVNAISSNYDTANDAKTTAERVEASIDGLTGDGGVVDMNTDAIAENAEAINANTVSIDSIESEVWDADGNSRIDANEARSMANSSAIMENTNNIAENASNIMGLRTDVDSNMGRITQNEADIMTNAGHIMANDGRITANEGRITANEGNISSNADAIAANMNSIGQNASAIGRNSEMITGLQDQMEIVRAGVAASMALAGMPAINGRGISIGVGSFDGESAFAVGFQVQTEMASFKVGVTSAGGETGASAGVGFQF